MEVTGAAVGIASLGIQVCQGLLVYYDAWKSYDSDISSTYNAITDLSKTLILLRTTLHQQADEERVGRVRSCVKDCEDALLKLDKKRDSLQKYSQPEGLRQKMRSELQKSWYPFRKETLEALKASVTDVQERLKLALQVLQLDIGTESERLVLRLLSQTTTQIDSIAQIAAQNQRILDAQKSDEFRKIFAWLAPPDPETNHATARQHHESQTGGWLLKSTQYTNWKTGAFSHLWMYGKAGCGKTVLSSTAIKDIRDTCEKDADTSYAFFYFSFSDRRKQSDGDLFRSLVAQLGWREPGLSMLRQAYQNSKHSVLGPDELKKILLEIIRSCSRVYLLVDALDECPEDHDTRQRVLEQLERLARDASNLSIFATSRELPTIRESMEAMGSKPLSVVTSSVDADIQIYVANQLSSDRSFRRFRTVTLDLIKSTIANKADGMFRWAYCQLQVLKRLKAISPKFVELALNALPATLDETYTRALLDIEEMYHDHALTLLRWLAYARSPPTLGELVEAAVIDPIHESSIDADNRGDLEDTLHILSGLVTVEQSNGHSETNSFTSDVSNPIPDQNNAMFHSPYLTSDTRVRLAHFSVKEYLESKRVLESGARQFHLESTTGHRDLAQSCLTYLRYYSKSPEKTSTEQDLESFPLLKYAAQSWYYHSALQCGGEASREVSLLRLEQVRDDWIHVHDPDDFWTKPFSRPEWARGVSGSAIYYASLLGLPAVVTKLLCDGANVNAEGGHSGTALQAASARGHNEIVQLLLDNGAKVDAVGGHYGTPLQAASAGGHKQIVQLLLDNGAKVDAVGGFHGGPLQAASAGGHKELVQLLLDNGAKVDAVGGEHATPLQAASAGGHKELAQLLLDNGAKVDAEGGYCGTPLHAASAGGHKDIVQLLLDNGAKVDAVGGHYGTPLHAASAGGHKELAQLLLDNRAKVDAVGGFYGTPLHAASAGGHKELVQLLLDNGAKVDAEGGFYGTPLHAASAEGRKELVQLLLENGAKVDAEGGYCGTPLHAASAGGHKDIVQLLLDNGAKVDAVGGHYGTPLHAASAEGRKELVQLLLENGAKVDAEGGYCGTPLHAASAEGRKELVQLLLDNGAKVDAVGGHYGTPLHAASAGGHKELAQLLLDNRAKVDAEGGHYGTPLHAASAEGRKELVQLLLDNGAKVDAEGGHYGTPLHAASAEGRKELVQLLLDNGAKVDAVGGFYGTPLQAASAGGHTEIVQLLLDNGAKVDAVGGEHPTPLQAASARGHKELAQLLLDNGAKVDAVGGFYGTPLQAASAEGHKELVQLLLDSGAKVDAVGGHYGTPLHAASAEGRKELVQLLLDNGAKVDAVGEHCGTPLHAASAEGCKEIVQLQRASGILGTLRNGDADGCSAER